MLGRPIADAVTVLGIGVDGAVRRIETAYDSAGRPYLFTSFDAPIGGHMVNQVLRQFNGLGQLTAEFQVKETGTFRVFLRQRNRDIQGHSGFFFGEQRNRAKPETEETGRGNRDIQEIKGTFLIILGTDTLFPE